MLGLDTNVLVRFLVQDDPAQSERATQLIQSAKGAGGGILISLLVLLETEWVLRSRYGLSKGEIAGALSALLDSSDIQIEDEGTVEEAVFHWKDSAADFADCLIGARNRALGCEATASFDARAASLPGFVRA